MVFVEDSNIQTWNLLDGSKLFKPLNTYVPKMKLTCERLSSRFNLRVLYTIYINTEVCLPEVSGRVFATFITCDEGTNLGERVFRAALTLQ